MAYAERLVIPLSTTEAAPSIVEVPIIPLTLKTVEITFPSGCAGLVGVWIEYQNRQILPNNLGSRFRGNDQSIRFSPGLELREPPFSVALRGINEDDTFPHTIYFMLDVDFPGGFFADILSRILPGSGPVALPGR